MWSSLLRLIPCRLYGVQQYLERLGHRSIHVRRGEANKMPLPLCQHRRVGKEMEEGANVRAIGRCEAALKDATSKHEIDCRITCTIMYVNYIRNALVMNQPTYAFAHIAGRGLELWAHL